MSTSALPVGCNRHAIPFTVLKVKCANDDDIYAVFYILAFNHICFNHLAPVVSSPLAAPQDLLMLDSDLPGAKPQL